MSGSPSSGLGAVERAYQLAAESRSLDEVRQKLQREGHSNVDAHLASPALRSELKKLLQK